MHWAKGLRQSALGVPSRQGAKDWTASIPEARLRQLPGVSTSLSQAPQSFARELTARVMLQHSTAVSLTATVQSNVFPHLARSHYLIAVIAHRMPPDEIHAVDGLADSCGSEPLWRSAPVIRNPLGVTVSDSNAAGGPATEAAVHVSPFVEVHTASFSP